MGKLSRTFKGNTKKIVRHIKYAAEAVADLGEETYITQDDVIIHIAFYYRYFWRNGRQACLSLTIVCKGDRVQLIALSGGGGKGLLELDWGISDDLIELFDKELDKEFHI